MKHLPDIEGKCANLPWQNDIGAQIWTKCSKYESSSLTSTYWQQERGKKCAHKNCFHIISTCVLFTVICFSPVHEIMWLFLACSPRWKKKNKKKNKSKCENIHLFPLILKLSLLMIINWSNTKTLHNKCAEHLLRTYRRLLETTNDVITRLEWVNKYVINWNG